AGEMAGGVGDRAVLAGAARADDDHHHARIRLPAHATRRPSRQTDRTTGTPEGRRTRTISARLPGAIWPRSSSPTVRAGFAETMVTACGKSMLSTVSARMKGACSRLKGT